MCVLLCVLGSSDENNIESVIDTSKLVGDNSVDVCDISSQALTGVNQPAQLSIATVSAANIEAQQVSYEYDKYNFLLINFPVHEKKHFPCIAN